MQRRMACPAAAAMSQCTVWAGGAYLGGAGEGHVDGGINVPRLLALHVLRGGGLEVRQPAVVPRLDLHDLRAGGRPGEQGSGE